MTEWNDEETAIIVSQSKQIVPGKIHAAARKRLAKVLRPLKPRMRIALRALSESFVQIPAAARMLKAVGHPIHERTLRQWMLLPEFRTALETVSELNGHVMDSIAPVTILGRTNQIAEHGREMVDVVDKDGAPTGEKRMRNADVALSALDKLGKNQKLWGNDQASTRVVLDFVNLTGRKEEEADIIEGEFVEHNGSTEG